MDRHCEYILEEYRENLETYTHLKDVVFMLLSKLVKENGLYVENVEARVKAEDSLCGKLELKGEKYASIKNITDILGARIITFYNDEVDVIAAIVEKNFEIDWTNSIDKRKTYDPYTFGYMSNHYICRVPSELYHEDDNPQLNEIWFEIQLRTALQHVWATIYHEIGYKSNAEIPSDFIRSLSRLSGVLELADDEFYQIRVNIEKYRKSIYELIAQGKFDEVRLDGDSFNYYLSTNPFQGLNERISKINNAEICVTSENKYYEILKKFGFNTLQDIEELKAKYSEKAYQLAFLQMHGKDLDIFSSSLALKNLCAVYMLENGGGEKEMCEFLIHLYGEKRNTLSSAQRLISQIQEMK